MVVHIGATGASVSASRGIKNDRDFCRQPENRGSGRPGSCFRFRCQSRLGRILMEMMERRAIFPKLPAIDSVHPCPIFIVKKKTAFTLQTIHLRRKGFERPE